MKLKKLLTIAIAMQVIFTSTIYSMVSCTFFSGNECIVECDGNSKEFENLAELSNGINEVTGKYFTVKEIKEGVGYDRLSFIGLNNSNNNDHYTLLLTGIHGFYPYLEIYYLNNPVHLNTLKLGQISSLKLYSNKYKCPESGTVDYEDLDKILFNDYKMNTKNLKINSTWNDYCVIV